MDKESTSRKLTKSLSEHLKEDCTAKHKEDCPYYKDLIKESGTDKLDKCSDIDKLSKNKEVVEGVKLLSKSIPGIKVRMVDNAAECLDNLNDNIRMSISESEDDFYHSQMNKYHAGAFGKFNDFALTKRTPNVLFRCMKQTNPKIKDFEPGIYTVPQSIGHSTGLNYDGTRYVPSSGSSSNVHKLPISFYDTELLTALDRPVAVFKNNGGNTDDLGSLLVLTRVKDKLTDTYASIPISVGDFQKELKENPLAKKKKMMLKSGFGASHIGTRYTCSSYTAGTDPDPYEYIRKDVNNHLKKGSGSLLYVDPEQIKQMQEEDKEFKNSGILWPDFEKPTHAKQFAGVLRPNKFKGHGLGLLAADFYDSQGNLNNASDEINSKFKELNKQYVDGDESAKQKMQDMLDDLAKVRGWSITADGTTYTKTINGNQIQKIREVEDLMCQNLDTLMIPLSYKDLLDHNNPERRFRIIDKGSEPVGWYDREKGEVCLVKGKADLETVCHEIGWHAAFHWAEKNSPELYKKMIEYAKDAPEEIKKIVRDKYNEDISEKVLLDEIGAERFTEKDIEPIKDKVHKEIAKGWLDKVKDGAKNIYDNVRNFFNKRNSKNDSTESTNIKEMTNEEVIRKLVKAIIDGKGIESISQDELSLSKSSFYEFMKP